MQTTYHILHVVEPTSDALAMVSRAALPLRVKYDAGEAGSGHRTMTLSQYPILL